MPILVVDDDARLRRALGRVLASQGFEIELAEDGSSALARLGERPFDLVVLDVMMPGPDGIDVCQRLRASGRDLPILMLTARDAVRDRVAGLEAGADDYLVKPFANEELVARVRALLRRSGVSTERLAFAGVEVDLETREVRRGGREIVLSRIEFELLTFLLRHPRQVLPRGLIYERVWGYDASGSSNSLDVFVGHLRRKLGLELEGRAMVEGEWAGRVTGLGDQRVEIAMMRTPDGHSRLELSRFLAPSVVADHRNAPVNALGYLRVMFAVDDIDETLAQLRKHGAELVSSEVVQYEKIRIGSATSAGPKAF